MPVRRTSARTAPDGVFSLLTVNSNLIVRGRPFEQFVKDAVQCAADAGSFDAKVPSTATTVDPLPTSQTKGGLPVSPAELQAMVVSTVDIAVKKITQEVVAKEVARLSATLEQRVRSLSERINSVATAGVKGLQLSKEVNIAKEACVKLEMKTKTLFDLHQTHKEIIENVEREINRVAKIAEGSSTTSASLAKSKAVDCKSSEKKGGRNSCAKPVPELVHIQLNDSTENKPKLSRSGGASSSTHIKPKEVATPEKPKSQRRSGRRVKNTNTSKPPPPAMVDIKRL